MIVGIISSLLLIAVFKRDEITFKSTLFVLSTVAWTDAGYLTSLLLYCLALGLANERWFSLQILLFCFIKFFEALRNWFYTLLALERLMFFYSPSECKVHWSIGIYRAFVKCAIIGVAIFQIPDIVFAISADQSYFKHDIHQPLSVVHWITDLVGLTYLPVGFIIIIYIATDNMKLSFEAFVYTQSVRTKQSYILTLKVESLIQKILLIFVFASLPSLANVILYFYVKIYPEGSENMHFKIKYVNTLLILFSIINSTVKFFIIIPAVRQYWCMLLETLHIPGQMKRKMIPNV